ncbi:MAG TPA: tetratricopeptide repeat protein [Pyrinomonadaceae bacterium]|nr:tetratricopeptide repeat protein [Pyrinomonadaceae bacterium]
MAFDKAKAIRAAEKYLAQGKIPAAIQEYARIAEHDAEDYTALNTLGDLYARVNQKQYAVACYRRVAEHYREQGFTLKAVAMYKKVTRFEATDPLTALALASLYEQQGLMADARAQYLVAADAFARSGSGRDALAALGRIADLDPEDTGVRLRLADGYAREGLADEGAEAYTVAGERLAARGKHEWALEAFDKALALRPSLHAALQGVLGAHVALGTAEQAAEILEQAVAARPRDVELLALLARAYVEAEDVCRADRATEDLVRLDPTSYTVFFEVARLYLQQGSVAEAVRLLGKTSEQALSGNQDGPLLELTQEVLARDPEHLAALRLLARVYAWQREDERLRMTLERLTDAAQAAGEPEEERAALAQLVRLAPDESRYSARLDALGGPVPEEAHAHAPGGGGDVPTFESFMLHEEAAYDPGPAAAPAPDSPAAEFEWNAVGEPEAAPRPAPPAESLVLERNGSEAGGEVAYDFSAPGSSASSSGFQEVDFGAPAASSSSVSEAAERMLLQELESVDFYIEQGYADIARETLDMLERQYGPHPDIDNRRASLPADPLGADPGESYAGETAADAPEEFELSDPAAFDFTTLAPPERDPVAKGNGNGHAPYAEIVADFVVEPATAEDSETSAAGASFVDGAPGFDTGAGFDVDAAFDAEAIVEPAVAPASPAADATALSHEPTHLPEAAPDSAHAASSRQDANAQTPARRPGNGLDPGLAAIFDEFRESFEEEGAAEDEDYETHYQMGLAYREMGLLDQAVEEFQIAAGLAAPADGTPRYLNCCNLLGHCFVQKGMPRPAAVWFKRGLDAPGHGEDEYQALRFDLAATFEQMGEVDRAVEIFSEVYAIDVNYRGVAGRLRELQKAVNRE